MSISNIRTAGIGISDADSCTPADATAVGDSATADRPRPVIVAGQDLDLRYTWLVDPDRRAQLSDAVGHTDADLFAPREAERLESIKRDVIATGERRQVVERLELDHRWGLFLVTVEPLRDPGRQTVGLTVVLDGLGAE